MNAPGTARARSDATGRNRCRELLAIPAVIVVAIALVGCRSEDRGEAGAAGGERIAVSPGQFRGFNVLLVSIDTVRADHVGCYGYAHAETPTLDGLAERGVRCARAVTPVPLTLPAHSSLLTGLNPQHHGARVNVIFSLSDRVRTLAEVLREHDYRTGAVISAFVLDRQFGLARGFEHYADDLTADGRRQAFGYRERVAEDTNRHALEWLDAHAHERFFLFVHYFDPHFPYVPPEPYADRHKDRPYDGEIAYADAQLGRLLSAIDAKGIRDKTLIVVVSDHGEGLGEHKELTHGLLLYDATVRVLMILSGPPPFPRGVTLARPVGLIDVVPTLLDLLGLPGVDGLDGVSLIRAPSSRARGIYIETLWTKVMHHWSPLAGVRRSGVKFILAPRPEIYDLQADPNELNNLYLQRAELAADLHQQLRELSGGDPKMLAQVSGNLPIDEESKKKLVGLGYVVASSAPATSTTELPDPKDMMETWSESQEAVKFANRGQFAEAVALLEPFVHHHPKDVRAVGVLAECYLNQGRSADAVRMFRRYAEVASRKAEPLAGLGLALIQEGKLDEGERALRASYQDDPQNRAALFGLGLIAAQRGQNDAAMTLFQKCVATGRGSQTSPAYHNIGVLHERAGRMTEARQAFEQAVTLNPRHVKAAQSLARMLKREGKLDEAVRVLARAVGKRNEPDARVQLAELLMESGRTAAAIEQLRLVLRDRPNHAAAHGALGLALVAQSRGQEAAKHLARCVELDPKQVSARMHLGVLLAREGKLDEARAHLEQVVKAAPQWSTARYNLGSVLARQNRLEEARCAFAEAVCLDPKDANARNTLGQVLLELGEREQAAEQFRRALQIAPGLESARENLRRASTRPSE